MIPDRGNSARQSTNLSGVKTPQRLPLESQTVHWSIRLSEKGDHPQRESVNIPKPTGTEGEAGRRISSPSRRSLYPAIPLKPSVAVKGRFYLDGAHL